MKKNKKDIIKIILELAVLILLILWIIQLISAQGGLSDSVKAGTAQEKLDEAIKIFTSSNGMKLEDAINNIEGLESLEINAETGEYHMIIDGQSFMVISQETFPEEGKNSINEVEVKDGQEN